MFGFSKTSSDALATCHESLQRLFREIIKQKECIIICGHRDQAAQDAAFSTHNSKLQWPHSRHNSSPSEAVDVAPLPLDWYDIESFKDFSVLVKKTALDLGIDIVWGGDFQTLKDYDHWELKRALKPTLVD